VTLGVRVPLDDRAYDVRIGRGLLARAGAEIAPVVGRARLFVVTEERVAALHMAALRAGLGVEAPALVLEPGEGTKSWAGVTRVVEWLLDGRCERGDVVVAFGGGVIGDLAGFAAAILRRGVRFVQVPTTLLAQVDSSVGGKTGINTRHGKNLVGAFHQPSLVLADVDVLETLSPRDFLAGYGEVAKYGLLGDEGFFGWLEANAPRLANDPALRIEAVRRSVQMKADIVARDETERGDRALLNLGHTFCHALEAATGYDGARLLHGEGVALGCALAFDLSARLGLCSQEAPSRVRGHLQAMGMLRDLSRVPGALPPPERLLDLMAQDKKVVGGRLRFVLARGVGAAFVTDEVPQEDVLEVLRASMAAAAT
jgi:3-dehydroquinate synthase